MRGGDDDIRPYNSFCVTSVNKSLFFEALNKIGAFLLRIPSFSYKTQAFQILKNK